MAKKMGRPTTLPEPWKSLADHYGGVGKLSEQLGVDASVVRRWAHGKCGMAAPARALLMRLIDEMRGAGSSAKPAGARQAP
jgi:hypothetical protein